jgi:hypothetical protein
MAQTKTKSGAGSKKSATYVRIKVFPLVLGCLCVFGLYYVYTIVFSFPTPVAVSNSPEISEANTVQFESDATAALIRVQALVNLIDKETELLRDAANTAWAGAAGVVVDEAQVVDNISELMKEATAVEGASHN